MDHYQFDASFTFDSACSHIHPWGEEQLLNAISQEHNAGICFQLLPSTRKTIYSSTLYM
jgi:hypothetical protein